MNNNKIQHHSEMITRLLSYGLLAIILFLVAGLMFSSAHIAALSLASS